MMALFLLAKLAAICSKSPAPPPEAPGLFPEELVEPLLGLSAVGLGELLLDPVETASETNGLGELPPLAVVRSRGKEPDLLSLQC